MCLHVITDHYLRIPSPSISPNKKLITFLSLYETFSIVSHHFYHVWHHSIQYETDGKLDFILWPESLTWLLFPSSSFSSYKLIKRVREKKECQSVSWLSELSTNFTLDGMMLSWWSKLLPHILYFYKFLLWPEGLCKVKQMKVSVTKSKKIFRFLPVAVFVILMLVGPNKCLKQLI